MTDKIPVPAYHSSVDRLVDSVGMYEGIDLICEAYEHFGLSDKEGHHKGGKKAPNAGKGSEMDGICNKIRVAGVDNGNGQATGNGGCKKEGEELALGVDYFRLPLLHTLKYGVIDGQGCI